MVNTLFHRLFFAILPPTDVLEVLAELRDASLCGNPMKTGRLHITILLMGDHQEYPLALAQQMVFVMSGIELPKCRVIFDKLVGANGSTLLSPSEPLEALKNMRAQLASIMAKANIWPCADSRFSPHITLRHGTGDGMTHAVDPISWQVDKLALIHSFVGDTKYETVGEWSLGKVAA